MNTKVLVVVGLAAVIAASTGVAFASNSNKHTRGADGDPVATTAQTETVGDTDNYSDNDSGQLYAQNNSQLTESVETQTVSAAQADPSYSESVSATEAEQTNVSAEVETDIQENTDTAPATENTPAATSYYTIRRVVDRTTGEEQSPQLVFGKFYGTCYMKLYDNNTAEILLNPSTAVAETGSYSISNGIMSVDFGTDRVAEYMLIYNDDNNLDFIVVPLGDFDIYFG